MSHLPVIAADLVAIVLLTFAIYFPRHHRRDLVVAFLGVNVGVLAVATTLGSSTIGAGLGLGLFGVLSIIRLRSDEISQHEVAYYFAALALGLLSGLEQTLTGLTVALMALIVATLFVGDHPRLFSRHHSKVLRLDVAHADETALRLHLQPLIGGRVTNLLVRQVDLVNDTTVVEVRYRVEPTAVRHEDVSHLSVGRARA